MSKATAAVIPLLLSVASAADLPPGYWAPETSRLILDKTRVVHLAPDLGSLSQGEQDAVQILLEVGRVMQRIYEDSRHPEALESARQLRELEVAPENHRAVRELSDLYLLFMGPIATTLENKRAAFLPVAPETPGRNVYPAGATREEIDAFLAKHPEERDSILGERTVVRRATPGNVAYDLESLDRHPGIDALHLFLREKLQSLRAATGDRPLYAIPQSLRWADDLTNAYRLLHGAAARVETDDPEFARYLRNRARDLLSDDYESGDASWVTGNFKHLNAQIGAYETYDDGLFGVKAFASLSLLKRSEAASRKLAEALRGLQALESALPYKHTKRVRESIPVAVYEVVADFGQARGANTATILPNDPLFARRYGRTILLRENIIRDPVLFSNAQARWSAVVSPQFTGDLTVNGAFDQTLWHEVGHYLGVDRDHRGRPLPEALESFAGTFEEMKADLVSVFSAPALRKSGYYDGAGLRSHLAAGILRSLLKNKPRRDEPYGVMWLIQFNWFLDHGLLEVDAKSRRLEIHYDRYHGVVSALLREVLEIQYAGDEKRAADFIERWTRWTPELHERLAKSMRDSELFRYAQFKYAALGE
jgi:hypothetical protein